MKPIKVDSMQNPMLKEFARLQKSRRFRQKSGKLAVEGPNLVREALKAGLKPLVVFYTRRYYDADGNKLLLEMPEETKKVVLSEKLFRAITATETPREVGAIFNFHEEGGPGFIQAEAGKPWLVLVLDRIKDPGNMGTIIRTAAAAGVDRLFYSKGSADPYNPKVLRSTAGAIFHLAVRQAEEPAELLKKLKQSGLQAVAATVHSSRLYWSVNFKRPTVIIIGNETEGISPDLTSLADLKAAIPLSSPVESLNAATAAAVIIYEAIRQRRGSRT